MVEGCQRAEGPDEQLPCLKNIWKNLKYHCWDSVDTHLQVSVNVRNITAMCTCRGEARGISRA